MNLHNSLNRDECQYGCQYGLKKSKLIKNFQFKYFKINLGIMMTNHYAIPIQAITLGKNPTVVHSFP